MAEITRQPGDYGSTDKLIKLMDELNRLECKVGWFESARYDDGLSVAEVAAQNEFGNPHQNIPPRPFMRPAVIENSPRWIRYIKSGAKRILQGSETTKNLMSQVAELSAGHIRKSIRQVTTPKLAIRTVQQRLKKRGRPHSRARASALLESGHTVVKPLIETGMLLNTMTYIVQDGEEVE